METIKAAVTRIGVCRQCSRSPGSPLPSHGRSLALPLLSIFPSPPDFWFMPQIFPQASPMHLRVPITYWPTFFFTCTWTSESYRRYSTALAVLLTIQQEILFYKLAACSSCSFILTAQLHGCMPQGDSSTCVIRSWVPHIKLYCKYLVTCRITSSNY